MQRIEITTPFKYAFRGHRVEQFDPGVRVVPDEVAEVAIAEKWGKAVPLEKMRVDELKDLVRGQYPDADIPEKITKAVLVEWLESGTQPLFGKGEIPLEDRDVADLLAIASEKYPDIVLPDVVEREVLIAFINDGDADVFVPGGVLEDKEIPELLEIAKGKYPDVEIPPEVNKALLIRFIESGVASILASGGGD